ncbi:MAG TPA: ABC transporter ATP-binding protein/permease [Candidatus Acutalibacter pullicola]|uniref:ABC transporter ATP-binding protein/permease n=1 Tax=Candidatus Acutalibacter pullicola TaxID=2838417 RepID=A0A9D2MTS6_9FIRM|nr:ABC transporter ATP-binding protein/permease [Candidatus Acutalibacter pullicola]
MLELKHITKTYPAGGQPVEALKGIDLQFRESEFVSILGPSGCGKTTLLNLIGGLDQYTSGDLVINGRSTKDYKDRDWDAYRNHSVGFVFQSYNLIPHQTVLQNVELALTLSGVSKGERRRRAQAALEQVGLGTQLKKRPSEMSGGQMQRVAIARAIVNDPDIILADEPTGALDTETSVQVMEILKEISKDRLVIMVTHNPELAQLYSTRIVHMLDGQVTGDTAPLSQEEADRERAAARRKAEAERTQKKPSMSLATSFGLSLKNLFTKKGRTALTSFAGSIGIIGISLIYAVSQGTTAYIDAIQEDTLSSYPLTLQAQTMDLGSLMGEFMDAAQSSSEHEQDAVYQKPMIYDLVNALNSSETIENDLESFKTYLEERLDDPEDTLSQAVSGVQYTYDSQLLVYTESVDGTILHSDSQELMEDLLREYFGIDMAAMTDLRDSYGMGDFAGLGGGSLVLWQEMLPGDDGALINPLLESQYDVVYGSWPNSYDEIVLVLDENNELDDMTLYALGLKPQEEMDAIMQAAVDQTGVELEEESWSYEEICSREYRTILNADCYAFDQESGLYVDLRDTEAGLRYLYDNGLDLKVSGIVRPNENATSHMLSGSIGYTSALTEYMAEAAEESAAVQAQLENPDTDIFTGLPFEESTGSMTDAEKETAFRTYVSGLEEEGKAEAYLAIASIPSQEQVDQAVEQSVGSMSREEMEQSMKEALLSQAGLEESDVDEYLTSMSDEELRELFTQMAAEQFKAQYAAQVQEQMAGMESAQMAAALDAALPDYTTEQCAQYYEEVLTFSDSTYEENLTELGYVNLEDPASINLYASSFENKDVIEQAIAGYNQSVDDLEQIQYTDYIGLMLSSVTSIINAITYVLIAFVAVSLVVSSIMIGVITLISVQERTKEIGILRAIGASKKNVSRMFNAETLIIGFTSGALGVVVTWLLCFPINSILHSLTGIQTLNAYLPPQVALVLVLISMALTLFSGIIPSRSAAKKDPVVALRTE